MTWLHVSGKGFCTGKSYSTLIEILESERRGTGANRTPIVASINHHLDPLAPTTRNLE
ncbi:hypothetical protein H257_03502 [Aphanomyces astaci]|uniref:Uncharacterized protein n=1 Tax=Aphanomyces astaci TaxID=112090 RepID=W4GY27_APHAT|nr:hypothetical protein H257_03502 [Aphanomyces astaci]ETV84241.1 hypothetical protein H257_03502 [Aphanomyces astaci]|eukprot:XP_009825933.1 hypothetical protein H257_03502 [Aphanomyces astaci]